VQKLSSLHKFSFFCRGSQAQSHNGLESVEEIVRVGKLEVEFFQVEFVKVEKVVKDGWDTV
jgi:hypothetical protein